MLRKESTHVETAFSQTGICFAGGKSSQDWIHYGLISFVPGAAVPDVTFAFHSHPDVRMDGPILLIRSTNRMRALWISSVPRGS